MITKELFNNNIQNIIDSGVVENYKLVSKEFEKQIILNKKNNQILFSKFKDNYLNTYGDDLSNIYSKTQDFVYRLNLLINYYLDFGFDKDLVFNKINDFVEYLSFDIFDACDYNSSDLENLIENIGLDKTL